MLVVEQMANMENVMALERVPLPVQGNPESKQREAGDAVPAQLLSP